MSEDTASFSIDDGLQRLVDTLHKETKVPGICVVVSRNGRRLSASAGKLSVNEETQLDAASTFPLGNIIKMLVSIVALELAWNGHLDLNVAIEEYLPELRGSIHGRSVSLSHLLSHTSAYRGIRMSDPKARAFTWDSFVEYLHHAPQLFTPGTVFSYEHTGAVLVDQVIQRVTGKRSTHLVSEMILDALGVSPGRNETEAIRSKSQAGKHMFDAAAGRYASIPWPDAFKNEQRRFHEFWSSSISMRPTSIADLVTLGEFLATGVRADGHAYDSLSTATISQIQRSVIELPDFVGGPMSEMLPASFTLGAARYTDGSYGVTSMTVGQCIGLRFDPRNEICVAVGVNAMQPYLRDLILSNAINAVVDAPPATPTAPHGLELSEWKGVYRGCGHEEVVASYEKGCLTFEMRAEGSQQMQSARVVLDDEGRLTMSSSSPDLTLGFIRAAQGSDFGIMVGLTAFKRVST